MSDIKSNAPGWNKPLIQRYAISGPRYTSYPTAPQLSNLFSTKQFMQSIQKSNAKRRALSLYVHIPFCDTVCYYCACNKIITANRQQAAPYLKRVYAEMAMQAKHIDQDRKVEQLHWGGGTPTFISDAEKSQLMAQIRNNFNLLDDDSGDYSIEVHPGRMDLETVSLLRELGFNRLSMGVQDFDPQVQQAVNRFNSIRQVSDLISAARREQFHSISIDIIYGLPLQTLSSIKTTLAQVIQLSPDRLSLFNYAHMPHLFKTQLQINEANLPAPEEKLQMFHYAIDTLCQAGYIYIGMDHFAKPTDSLVVAQEQGLLQRNFQGYSTHGNCDLLAFGVSAISSIDHSLVQNHKAVVDYNQSIDAGILPISRGLTLNSDDLLRKQIIMQLICHLSLDISAIEAEFSIDFAQYFAPEIKKLAPMITDGLVSMDNSAIVVLDSGRLLIRAICMVFDAYLKPATETGTLATSCEIYSENNSEKNRYSQII